MKLLIIRGTVDAGKTTTCALLHNELVTNCGAEIIHLEVILGGYYGNVIPIPDDGNAVDFYSVLKVKNTVVSIISPGDDAQVLKEDMNNYISKYHPEIMIVCARARDVKGSSIRMIKEYFPSLYNLNNEIWTTHSENSSDKIKVKEPVICKLFEMMQL